MKKVLIFGATGNVGSYVTKYAKENLDPDVYEVIASGRRETSVFDDLGVPYYQVDMTNPRDFEKLPQDDVYAVIDLAAQIPSYMKGYQPDRYIQSNIVGTYNLLEYCRRVGADRMLYSTTIFDIAEYPQGMTLAPDLPLNFDYKGDHALYVISKNTAVELMEHYHQEYGIKKFVFRFPTIYNYSPYHFYHPNGVKTIRPLYKVIDQATKGEPIEIWGDPSYAKDMVHVNDCAQMICLAVEADRDGGFYNVGTGVPVTLQEQVEAIIDVFSPDDRRSPIVLQPSKASGGGFLMDVTNAREELGYEPKYSVHDLFLDYKSEMEKNTFGELREQEAESAR